MAKKYTRKLTKQGNYSYYIILPKEIIYELNWRERQKLILRRAGKKIIIEDWTK